jgi:two-component sensor histidine kinase
VNLEDLYRLLRTEHVQAQSIVDTVREPLLVLDRDLRVVAASRSFYETFRVERDETVGQLLYELGSGQWDIPDLRRLLEDVIPRSRAVEGYEVEHAFPDLGRRTMLLSARRLFHPDNTGTTLLLAIEDVTERRRVEHERELRFGELRHRVKNLLAVIQALARQTVAEDRSGAEYRDAFLGRLEALTHAHELAFGTGGGVDLATLAEGVLEPYTVGNGAVAVEAGPAATLPPARVQALALVLHELATNAVKHGALSAPEGRVRVGWEVEGGGGTRRVRLRWEERGGPPVAPPAIRGSGTELIEHVATDELGEQPELTFASAGLGAEITVPLGQVPFSNPR